MGNSEETGSFAALVSQPCRDKLIANETSVAEQSHALKPRPGWVQVESHHLRPSDADRLAIRSKESTNMKNRLVTFVCVFVAIGSVCVFAYAFNSPTSRTEQALAPFEFRRDAAPTPNQQHKACFLGLPQRRREILCIICSWGLL